MKLPVTDNIYNRPQPQKQMTKEELRNKLTDIVWDYRDDSLTTEQTVTEIIHLFESRLANEGEVERHLRRFANGLKPFIVMDIDWHVDEYIASLTAAPSKEGGGE